MSHHTRIAGHPTSHHSHMAGNHHPREAAGDRDRRVASDDRPAGFSHGNASWKQNGGTPPGWSHGNKTGWGCTPGSKGCMPPGLAKKAGANPAGANTPVSHTRTASHTGPIPHTPRMATPGSHTPRAVTPVSHTPVTTHPRPTPASFRTQPASHTPGKPHGSDAQP